jgi:lipoprotein-releasing system permease protein
MHDTIAHWPGVAAVSRVLEEKAILQVGDNQSVIQLKGVDEQYSVVSRLSDRTYHGQFSLGTEESPQLVLGAGVEDALGIQAGRELASARVFLPRQGGGRLLSAENIQESSLYVSGSFLIQQDFDEHYGITRYDHVRSATGLPEGSVSSLDLKLTDIKLTNRVKQELRSMLGSGYLVEDRYEQNRSLYGVMNAERWIVYGILSLILVVGAFTMIGALTMLILEKQTDIQILRALGGEVSVIRRIFLTEGILLAAIGAGIGMMLALSLVWAQQQFHLIPLGGGSFLIDHYPVELKGGDFVLIGATVFLIAGLASWFPANKAAKRIQSLRTQ